MTIRRSISVFFRRLFLRDLTLGEQQKYVKIYGLTMPFAGRVEYWLNRGQPPAVQPPPAASLPQLYRGRDGNSHKSRYQWSNQ
jgi:hypothetical protein